jgi:hypothetical protein
MAKKTRLWYVSLLLEPTKRHDWYNWRVVVEVADRDPGRRKVRVGRRGIRVLPVALPIRTITPTAAGRQYIRHNLARGLEEILVGPDTDGWDWDLVEHYRKKTSEIRVVKEPKAGS